METVTGQNEEKMVIDGEGGGPKTTGSGPEPPYVPLPSGVLQEIPKVVVERDEIKRGYDLRVEDIQQALDQRDASLEREKAKDAKIEKLVERARKLTALWRENRERADTAETQLKAIRERKVEKPHAINPLTMTIRLKEPFYYARAVVQILDALNQKCAALEARVKELDK